MIHNYTTLLCLFGILACFTIQTDAIVGGDIPKENQFPYQVAILDPEHDLVCGGGIISQIHILTAANCVIHPDGHFRGSAIKILASTNNLLRIAKPAKTIAVEKVYVPAIYTPLLPRTIGDIAVLKLVEPLHISRHVRIVHLPVSTTESYAGKTGTIAGFGWDKVRIENNQAILLVKNVLLRYGHADILVNGQYGYSDAQKISSKHMVARIKQRNIEQRGACLGDSGGPLVVNETVVGVLSMNPKGCTEKEKPSIYTRVSEFMQFIHDAVKDKNHKFIRSHVLIP